jgi:4-amino-4-deoxy-L-arabinose transferase-like glycosyltransferase
MKTDRWLWSILILGAAVRLPGLGERSLSYDECQQFWASQGNVLISNRQITLDPPGFACLLHIHALVGRGETWLRLLPCLFGILAVVAVYRLAMAAHAGRWTARAAAFFIALAPYAIRYSQSLRVYSQAMCFSALLVAAFLDVTDEEEGRGWSGPLLLGAFTCAALLSLYGSVWIVGVMVVLLVYRGRHRRGRAWGRALAGLTVGILLALPVYLWSVPVQLGEGTPASFYADKFPPSGLLPALRFFGRGTLDLFAFVSFIRPLTGLVFGALAVLGMVRLRRARQGADLVVVFLGSLILAAAASAFRLYPYGGTRQMLFLAPLFYVLGAAGIESLRSRAGGWAAAGCLLAIVAGSGIFLYRYHTGPGGQEMRPVIRSLQATSRPDDRILVNKDALPQFRFYYRGDPGRVIFGRETVIRDYVSEVNRLLATSPRSRWWLIFSHGWNDERRRQLADVDPGFVEAQRIEAHQAAAYLFAPRTVSPLPHGDEDRR